MRRTRLDWVALAILPMFAASGCGSIFDDNAKGAGGKGSMESGFDNGLNPLKRGLEEFSSKERPPFQGFPVLESARSGVNSGESGESAPVEEGDIYKVVDGKLYYLNTYKGLLVYDISRPSDPRLIAHADVYGYPVEMYHDKEGGFIFALVNDAMRLRRRKDVDRFERLNTAQLVAVNVSELGSAGAPKEIEISTSQTVDIDGRLMEGLSRRKGDAFYIVAHQPRWWFMGWSRNREQDKERAFLYPINWNGSGFDFNESQRVTIFEGGEYYRRMNNSDDLEVEAVEVDEAEINRTESRYFSSVKISATDNYLMVAQNWNNQTYSWNGVTCGSSTSMSDVKIDIFDISGDSDRVELYATIQSPGQITDQFKQTFDEENQVYYGVFWENNRWSMGCESNTEIHNTLKAYNVAGGRSYVSGDAAFPIPTAQVRFGKPGEAVQGTLFDMDNNLLYAITAEMRDPLYAIGIETFRAHANRGGEGRTFTRLEPLAIVDDLNGSINLFRFADAGKKYLLGFGWDNGEDGDCSGQGDADTDWWKSRIAVSLFDVSDVRSLRQMKLVNRECVAVEGGSDRQWSNFNWNRDQAHKMINLFSNTDGAAYNLISVPLSYRKQIESDRWASWRTQTAVGLMSWNLDAATDEKKLNSYTAVEHERGMVRRTHVYKDRGKFYMLALSDTHLTVHDVSPGTLTTGSAPEALAVEAVAPYVGEVYNFGSYLIEHHKDSPYSWGTGGVSEFRIRAKQAKMDLAGEVDESKIFRVTDVEKGIKVGENLLVLIRTDRSEQFDGDGMLLPTSAYDKYAVVYKIEDGAAEFKGEVQLPMQYVTWYRYWCGTPAYWFRHWGDASGMAVTDSAIVWLASYPWLDTIPEAQRGQPRLVTLDLRQVAEQGSEVTEDRVDELPVNDYIAEENTLLWIGDSPDPRRPNSFLISFKSADSLGERDDLEASEAWQKVKYYVTEFNIERSAGNGTQITKTTGALNVPGQFVQAAMVKGSPVLLARDNNYVMVDGNWQERPRLNLVELTKSGSGEGWNGARLLDSVQFNGNRETIKSVLMHAKSQFSGSDADLSADEQWANVYVASGQDWSWGWRRFPMPVDVAEEEADDIPNGDSFWAFNLRVEQDVVFGDGSKHDVPQFGQPVYQEETGSTNWEMMGVQDDFMFVNLQGDGILALDVKGVRDDSTPLPHSFHRTRGWGTHIAFFQQDGGSTPPRAFIASGYYGIYDIDLAETPSYGDNAFIDRVDRCVCITSPCPALCPLDN